MAITIIARMAELSTPVGLGLAARGDVQETVDWVVRAERLGLESVWLHDSYFERDPISFLAPMAQATKRIRLGAGALNPYTRHPFVVASTMASLDNLAEGRLSLALGSGLPLRLAQMNIPFDNAPARVSESIDQIRTLWRGERLVLNDKAPPLVPMFPPPRRIPIYIAAYTKAYLELAGKKADGYLSRPMESIPAFALMRDRVLDSAERHGRDASAIDFRGYLLSYISDSRQEALNRAKREPFVIYMISILSDISMSRAGFPKELRDQVNQLWRAEDYHRAAQAIPDELLEAFVLAGTRHDVAARARVVAATVPWFWGTAVYPPDAALHTVAQLLSGSTVLWYVYEPGEPLPPPRSGYTLSNARCWTGVCVTMLKPSVALASRGGSGSRARRTS